MVRICAIQELTYATEEVSDRAFRVTCPTDPACAACRSARALTAGPPICAGPAGRRRGLSQLLLSRSAGDNQEGPGPAALVSIRRVRSDVSRGRAARRPMRDRVLGTSHGALPSIVGVSRSSRSGGRAEGGRASPEKPCANPARTRIRRRGGCIFPGRSETDSYRSYTSVFESHAKALRR